MKFEFYTWRYFSFFGVDSVTDEEAGAYLGECLNALQLSGFPPHNLHMLLRNPNP